MSAGRVGRWPAALPALSGLPADQGRSLPVALSASALVLAAVSGPGLDLGTLARAAALLAAGAGAAWLGAAWWGDAMAGLVAGLCFQLGVLGEAGAAPPARVAALALLPIAWGFLLRAVQRGGAASIGAVVGAAGLLVAGEEAATALLLLCAALLGASLRAPSSVLRRRVGMVVGVLGAAVVIAAPALVLQEPGSGVAFPLPVLPVLLGAAGFVLGRNRGPRLVLPLVAVVAGLGPLPGAPAAALGVALLAGAGAAPLIERMAAWAAARSARASGRPGQAGGADQARAAG